MSNISSGIKTLDAFTDSFYIGDNVVWELNAGTPFDAFIKAFIRQATIDKAPVIYVSFNRSPQTILKEISAFALKDSLVLLDCFSSGKGKGDDTFTRFYRQASDFKVVKVDNPSDIESFTISLNAIEDTLPSGARYLFDSLTGMQDLWSGEGKTYRFFTYMCPRLFDLETVAYWMLEEDAHSKNFKANLRHITQVVFNIYTRGDKMFIKAKKLAARQQRALFRPHQFFVSNEEITITSPETTRHFYIGKLVQELRDKRNLSQRDLADRLNVTASFISQIENNQISPSVHSLIEFSKALNVNPTVFFDSCFNDKKMAWVMRRSTSLEKVFHLQEGICVSEIFREEQRSASIFYLDKGITFNGHFNNTKRPELVFVVKGHLSIVINGQQESLTSGDCLLLKESCPAQWNNEGGDVAEILIIW